MLRGTRSPDPPAVVAAAGEVHSGAYLSFLSETQAQEGLRPPPAAQRRGPGLRLRLLLWLLLCGLTPTLLILTVAAARAALQAQIHLSQVTLLLRDSLPVEPRGATPSLASKARRCSAAPWRRRSGTWSRRGACSRPAVRPRKRSPISRTR